MITYFEAKDYRCLRDVKVSLTPLHAFIGPNDSGKSTLLRGIGTAVQLGGATFRQSPMFAEVPNTRDVRHGAHGAQLLVRSAGDYSLRIGADDSLEEATAPVAEKPRQWVPRDPTRASSYDTAHLLGRVAAIRFDTDRLRQTSRAIPEGKEVSFADSRGKGLPGIYQNLIFRADGTFDEISRSVAGLFPTVSRLQLGSVAQDHIELRAHLRDGSVIPAADMSEGLLYYLGFAALQHVSDVGTLLVEEPENGLHPSRIADIVRILRDLSEKRVQVLIATHSPLVVNELQPKEVTVVVRPSTEEGTKVYPIEKTPNFAKRSKLFSLGELWLSYADGELEKPLIEGVERVGDEEATG